ncbi:Ribonuclease H1 [Smittium mucronatum]|uniref:ribonuclease H n=1 Tax=Smittium mucronatum TaxID=133383 RepID=A0A1R0GZI0_9FUNG|nr:Ribonuclease H1 [Smittium mucronatum]
MQISTYIKREDAKKQVFGFSGADHKKFVTRKEAEEYLKSAPKTNPNVVTVKKEKHPAPIDRDSPANWDLPPHRDFPAHRPQSNNLNEYGGREFGKKRSKFNDSSRGRNNKKHGRPYDQNSDRFPSGDNNRNHHSHQNKNYNDHNRTIIGNLDQNNFSAPPIVEDLQTRENKRSRFSEQVEREIPKQNNPPDLSHRLKNNSVRYDLNSTTLNPSRFASDNLNSNGSNKGCLTQQNPSEPLVIYTDGACRGNGKSNSRAGVGVYFGDGDIRNISERLKGKQTNNRAELTAVLRALEEAEKHEPERNLKTPPRSVLIMTDSQYVINCMTKWLFGWACNGWRTSVGTSVLNKDLIEKIHELILNREGRVKFEYVKAHNSDPGNEAADTLAVRGSVLPEV